MAAIRGVGISRPENSTTLKRARAQPPQLILRTHVDGRNSGVNAEASSLVLKGSYTPPLNFQRPPETIDGEHFTPVHGNRRRLKETSDDLAQNFRSHLHPRGTANLERSIAKACQKYVPTKLSLRATHRGNSRNIQFPQTKISVIPLHFG